MTPPLRIQMKQKGFTLTEVLTAIAILAFITVMLASAFNQTSKAWLQSENRVETFQSARAALDFMAKELTQAIVISTNVQFLANFDSLAFIAPVSDNSNDRADLMEVVYRLSWKTSSGTDPSGIFVDNANDWPKKLVRRTSAFATSGLGCWDYGSNSACPNPWDFYGYQNWPETSQTNRTAILIRNVMSLRFKFRDIMGNEFDYWNSSGKSGPWGGELPQPIGGCAVPGQPPCTYMTNAAPAGVMITIGVIDDRTVTRLKQFGYGTATWNNLAAEATRYFTTYVSIPQR